MECKTRTLADLSGVGKACLEDFKVLGIKSVAELGKQNPEELYFRLCARTGSKQDICVLDVFRCAVEQAKDPDLAPEKKNWWYWSQQRKSAKH